MKLYRVSRSGSFSSKNWKVLSFRKIFATPGIGPYFVDAAFNRDYFLSMGIVILFSVLLLFMNLAVDVVYGFLDPRIRYE